MKQRAKRLRDTWQKLTNISPLVAQVSAQTWRTEVQYHLSAHHNEPLQTRICHRAELWTNPITRHGFGYGNGNRAKRRAYRLWQEALSSAEQMEAAAVKPLHCTQISWRQQ